MKLGLGTAQFGMSYGVTNADGQVSEEEVGKILALAQESGITILDTAPGYGESEAILVQYLPHFSSFRLITKTPFIDSEAPEEQLWSSVESSCRRLHCSTLEGLLVHRAEDLTGSYALPVIETLQ